MGIKSALTALLRGKSKAVPHESPTSVVRTLEDAEREVERELSVRSAREHSVRGGRELSVRGGREPSVRGGRELSARGGREHGARGSEVRDYGSSAHGGHGRERMYDDDSAKTFGRQHGSEEALTFLAGSEALTIPAAKVSVHIGERSESYVRGQDGEFYEEAAGPLGSSLPRAMSSPKAVVTVHSAEVEGDSGAVGASGRRNRGSFNSLLLLEAQELAVQGGSPRPGDGSGMHPAFGEKYATSAYPW